MLHDIARPRLAQSFDLFLGILRPGGPHGERGSRCYDPQPGHRVGCVQCAIVAARRYRALGHADISLTRWW